MSLNYRFRSGAEKTAAEYLDSKDVGFDFEPHYIPYMWIEHKKYLPDFVLDDTGIILEVKGRFTREDRKKHLFLRQSNHDADVRITDVSGVLVYATIALGGQAVWNGHDYNGQRVQTGVYLIWSTNKDGSETKVSKLLIFN